MSVQVHISSHAMMEQAPLHDNFLCRSGRSDDIFIIFVEIFISESSVNVPNLWITLCHLFEVLVHFFFVGFHDHFVMFRL